MTTVFIISAPSGSGKSTLVSRLLREVESLTFSVSFTPSGTLIASETGAATATNGSAISSYSILQNGKLTPISQSLPTDGAGNCWQAITPNGKFVYTSNSGSDNISGFSVGTGGVLTPIGGTIVGSNPQGSHNVDIAVTADGNYLYTINSMTGAIGSSCSRTPIRRSIRGCP